MAYEGKKPKIVPSGVAKMPTTRNMYSGAASLSCAGMWDSTCTRLINQPKILRTHSAITPKSTYSDVLYEVGRFMFSCQWVKLTVLSPT
jgi:hypothetical protein